MVKDMRETVIENLRDNVAKEFGEDYRVETGVTEKINNIKLQSITIFKNGENAGPNIYVEDYINAIMAGRRTIAEVTEIVKEIYNESSEMPDCISNVVNNITDKEYVLSRVEYRIVNGELNKSRLANSPKKDIADLYIIYIVVIGDDDQGMVSITVDNNMMEKAGVSFEELDAAAKKNTEKESLMVKNIADVLLEGAEKMSIVNTKEIEMVKERPAFLVVSNGNNLFGARVILRDNLLSGLAKKLGGDFYILPSSVHEVMVAPVDEYEDWFLKDLVKEANKTSVYTKDKLSDNIYRYYADTEHFEIVEV